MNFSATLESIKFSFVNMQTIESLIKNRVNSMIVSWSHFGLIVLESRQDRLEKLLPAGLNV